MPTLDKDWRMKNVIDWLFRDRRTGKIVLVQWPNIPLWIFIAVAAIRLVASPKGSVGTALTIVGTAALVWWAVEEIWRGVNGFRRILGGVVLAFTVVGLFMR